MRYVVLGGAPISPALVNDARVKIPKTRTILGYGMTENTCASAMTWPGAPDDVAINTVGKPLPHIEMRIADEQGNTLPRGQVGEVNTRGYTVFEGYVKDPEKTAENFHSDGWWRTGDLGW